MNKVVRFTEDLENTNSFDLDEVKKVLHIKEPGLYKIQLPMNYGVAFDFNCRIDSMYETGYYLFSEASEKDIANGKNVIKKREDDESSNSGKSDN
jgi:hypothetical protein